MKTILIVDDEASIVEVCKRYLESEGFHTLTAENGEEALECYRKNRVDLIIVDIMMPKMDGYTLVERIIEKDEDVCFLFLSALNQEKEKLYGLTLGADDYLTKPFSPRELVLRVKNILRRSWRQPESLTLHRNPIDLDKEKRLARIHGKVLDLTIKEFDLLWLLANEPQRVFSKSELLEKVWGYDFLGDANTINVHIHHLRDKLHVSPDCPDLIKTVWGLGYKFEGETGK
ncbi:response regulator transcription factor [Terrilactibacillus laevilacticus]|uniref:response regulator transcription factor n=1 Tax=Terrilactibacillus laevilacticus TaxID=1380157 RepID=UPI001146F165|nr:response regulator transcription factor [Terrilactibacillus laevilacticus]